MDKRRRKCPSLKIGYPTKGEADAALRRIQATTHGAHRECRTYPCAACGEWHTTHKRQPKGQAKRARARERDHKGEPEG